MTLVYIPGLLSDGRVWRQVAERVGGAFRLAGDGGGETITAMAESVLRAVQGRIVPVGHSMGARIALEAASHLRLPDAREGRAPLEDLAHGSLGSKSGIQTSSCRSNTTCTGKSMRTSSAAQFTTLVISRRPSCSSSSTIAMA